METPNDCTVSPHPQPRHSPRTLDCLSLAALTLAVLLIHGYHPWAEDGGLYVAGVEYTLDPSLFPHETAFVTEHLHYSIFAPFVAALVRSSHGSLAAALFGIYLCSTALMLAAALRVVRRCLVTRTAQWTAVSLLAAWWTLPVAGTSLLLMDPYVTARSLSTPLSLFAVGFALDPWPERLGNPDREHPYGRHSAILCGVTLALAAAFHPLMAGYALAFVVVLRLPKRRTAIRVWPALAFSVCLLAAAIQWLAKPEGPAAVAAAYSRYYWFLSQWQWFEWLGLLGPLLIFAALLRWGRPFLAPEGRSLCKAALLLGAFSLVITACFAQEHLPVHAVARLQPLRAFLLLYAAMILLLGGALVQGANSLRQRVRARLFQVLFHAAPAIFVSAMALVMCFVQRQSFPASLHLELPGRRNPNFWVEAFNWARQNTPPDAIFALDARYVNTNGEDAQTFRAIAQRSAIPDFSKDGGEAAISPSLAPEWLRSAQATQRLSLLSDGARDLRLRPFGVQWMVLHADASTGHPCPYTNSVVKICRLAR